ncbi:hypothetical protein F53441_13658 [Fusarium austroafricanum]|uniref:Uncharacterized protein n=1 Tax=Fusarium austroafricanum TaxID=2364996 RepID=A0A8H4NJY3_9HYPO|nr:hypothetical protein F53441_13658 [Fusarium austroafricanum]
MSKSSSSCSSTCKDFPKEIPSYGDIGGIGVALAFIVTAWMVVVVLIGYYLTVFDPKLDPFRKEGTQKLSRYPNSIDYSVHELLQKIPGLGSNGGPRSARYLRLGAMLNACILMLADLQIFTALSILVGAYASMGCEIVAYHWQYMIYLAWLASVTHLAGLSFLRNHLANNGVKCYWRLAAMFFIQSLLSAAVGLATHFGDDPWLKSGGGRPAICYFKEHTEVSSNSFQSAVKIIILLVWGFFIRVAKMFQPFEGGLRKCAAQLHKKARNQRYETYDRNEWDFRHGIFKNVKNLWLGPWIIATLEVLSIQLDLFTSFLAEVYWLLFSIIWITIRLVNLRNLGNQDDSKWTFGQVLPVFLLIAPFATAVETFCSKQETPHNQEDPVNNDDIRGLGHTHTSGYRGVFFLGVLSYIEIGIYFVLSQRKAEGLAAPLIQIFVSVFAQLELQVFWVVSDLWLSNSRLNRTLKRTICGFVFLLLSAMSISANFVYQMVKNMALSTYAHG